MLRCGLAKRGVAADADFIMLPSFELDRIRIECWVVASNCWNVSRGVGGGGETGGGVEHSIGSMSITLASVEMVRSSSSSSGP